MTRVDNYLEKYLDGSISEGELQHFRDLLDAEPRLRAELLQTLELRSIIHDDLLALTPPEALSTFVRERLSDQFAELAEEEEERGLPFFFSQRFAGSSLVAMVALVLIALAPTLIAPSGGGSLAQLGVLQSNKENIASPSLADVSTTHSATEQQIPVLDEGSLNTLRVVREPVSSPQQNIHQVIDANSTLEDVDQNPIVERVEPLPVSVSDASELAAVENEFLEEQDLSPSVNATADNGIASMNSLTLSPKPLSAIGQDPDELLASTLSNANLLERTQPKSRYKGANTHRASLASRSNTRPMPLLSNSESSRRRIMFGGTLASGLTTKESTFSVQGAAYLALALDEKSRIGLEGGSAMFRYRKVISVETEQPLQGFARRSHKSDDEQGLETVSGRGFGSDIVDVQYRAGGGVGGSSTGSGGGSSPSGESVLPNAVVSGERNSSDFKGWTSPQILGGGRTASQPVVGQVSPEYDLQSHESEASMIYGLVFYDHTVTSLNKKLNIHGRVGVGGADGGIVLSARAYAAVSTHENVAWTLGVGGSMLHEFSQDVDFNANYGVNAGVELGF